MRRIFLVLALLIAFTGAAAAEDWSKYIDKDAAAGKSAPKADDPKPDAAAAPRKAKAVAKTKPKSRLKRKARRR